LFGQNFYNFPTLAVPKLRAFKANLPLQKKNKAVYRKKRNKRFKSENKKTGETAF
jgi:hypothetical protein